MQNEYELKKDEQAAKKMCLEWHPFVNLQKKGNRVDIKTDIKGLANYYKKTIK